MSAIEDPQHLDGQDWRLDAACRGMDPDVFFPPDSSHTTDPAFYLDGQVVCAGCPVTIECLEYALTDGIDEGVYGNRTPAERRAMRRRLRLAPPPDLDAYLFPTTPETTDDHDDD